MTASFPRQKGSKEIWLKAAYEMLICDGIDAVKVMPLAKRLNLSRTGFYWFFADLAELHVAMIERWESQNTGPLLARCSQRAGSVCAALFNVMDCWLDPTLFDARLDLAIRNWARVDTALQHRVADADHARIAALTELFLRYGFSAEQAQVRALTVIYTQIGYISMQIEEGWQERLARVQQYVEIFAGTAPQSEEVAQFLARHPDPHSGV